MLLKSIATKPSRVRPSSLPSHYVEEGGGGGNTTGIRETRNKKEGERGVEHVMLEASRMYEASNSIHEGFSQALTPMHPIYLSVNTMNYDYFLRRDISDTCRPFEFVSTNSRPPYLYTFHRNKIVRCSYKRQEGRWHGMNKTVRTQSKHSITFVFFLYPVLRNRIIFLLGTK